MRPTKREMFIELHARVCNIRNDAPEMNLYDAVFLAVNSPAPKFYMTPGYALNIIYKTKKDRHKM